MRGRERAARFRFEGFRFFRPRAREGRFPPFFCSLAWTPLRISASRSYVPLSTGDNMFSTLKEGEKREEKRREREREKERASHFPYSLFRSCSFS